MSTPIKTYTQSIAYCEKFYGDNFANFEKLAKDIVTQKAEWQKKIADWTAAKSEVTEEIKTYVAAQLTTYKAFSTACDQIAKFNKEFIQTIKDLDQANRLFENPEIATFITRLGLTDDRDAVINAPNSILSGKKRLMENASKVNDLCTSMLALLPAAKRDMDRLEEYVSTGTVTWWVVSQIQKLFGYTPSLDQALSKSPVNASSITTWT